ncbi:MAG: ABC transporter ATP-binding protein, partial [Nitrospinota bacterium]
TMERYERKRFHDENKSLYDISVKEAKRDEIVSPVMEFLASLGAGLVILYGGQQVLDGNTTPGTFFSFLTALMLMYEPIRKLSKMNNVVQQALAAGERIFAVMDEEVSIADKVDAKGMKSFRRGIRFEQVSFRYSDELDYVLNDINFDVAKGEVIAVVGNSGAGKSTLLDLLPRYYDPVGGRILLDDTDIRDIKLDALREMIGVVTQETILFNDTVWNNIAYGRKEAAHDEVVHAAKLAYADTFIVAMPDGYDTLIGERGVRLSGGERQRLSIARAILKNPSILLLDEATSNLDSESEALVQEALENLMQERTTFVIAHRLSTIIQANTILVMSNGQIVETGTHSRLLNNTQGLYRSLYDIQYKNHLSPSLTDT